MTTTKFYLDTRGTASGKPSPLKLAITKKGKTALLCMDVQLLPTQWDRKAGKVISHPNKLFLNTYLGKRKQDVDNIILELITSGEIAGIDATGIKRKVQEMLSPERMQPGNNFSSSFLQFANSKKEGTRQIYMYTYKRMLAYVGDEMNRLKFEDITKEWLTRFDAFLQRTSPSKNARNIHLRNIRAVFNEAIDEGITSAYPFRRFKIRPVATVKRSLSTEQLRELFALHIEGHEKKYLDLFKLIFFLIGINIVDLCKLRRITNGRVEYYRSKTNRLYSIKVEPEAMEIISKYKGEKYLLNILDRYSNYKDFRHRMNDNLKKLGHVEVGKHGKKTFNPLFPALTTYWARHSWATIAASLDIPKETIAAALGHGGNTVTDIYIDFDRRKVDEANRRVLDWVLYGKRE